GDLSSGNVGQGSRDEVDIIPAGTPGMNFGWRPREGTIATPGISNEQPVSTPTGPVYDYGHSNGNAVVIGGYVYRGTAITGLQGTYFFADFAGNHFWSFRSNGTNVTSFKDRSAEIKQDANIGGVSAFGEGA